MASQVFQPPAAERPAADGAARASALGRRVEFWACVAVVLVFSQFWVMPLTGAGDADVDPSVAASIRNYYFPAYLLVLVLAATRPRATAMALVRAAFLSLLVALAFVSISWSIDPEVTLRRAVAVMFTTLAGVALVSRLSWPRFLQMLATAFGIVVALCYGFAILAPSYGRMTTLFPGAWRGVWGQKNALGFNMSLGAMVFAAAAILDHPRRKLWVVFALAAVVLLLLSQSKTSIVSLVIGGACIALVGLARRGPVGAVLATFLGVTTAMLLGFMMLVDPDILFAALGKEATLTGRTKVWAAVLKQIHQRPWTGYGYGAVWDDTSLWGPVARISKEQGFVIHEAHNSWLGVWLELGYIGLAAAGLLFASMWARTLAALYRQPRAYLALPVLAVFSLHTLTETEVLVQNDWLWTLFSAVAVKLAAPADGDLADPLTERAC